MKKHKELWSLFLTKEKLFLIVAIFILINLSIYIVYRKSIYSQPGYFDAFPQAGLEFYYYLHCIGLNQFIFFLMMLLVPNIISYDFLNYHQNHSACYIEMRIGKENYYKQAFIMNIIMTTLVICLLEILIVFTIHFFYAPLQFNAFDYPELYYRTTQILSSHEFISLICFIILTSLGYGLISSVLFSMQIIISNKYIYRCFGVIFGILLVLLPAFIQVFVPIENAAFVLQINNLVALGMENVRENPFFLPHWLLYGVCFSIYATISYYSFIAMLKWRQRYD